MAAVVQIDSNKIVEVLFDHAERVPNNVYVNLMNMIKRYHDDEEDEGDMIRTYIKNNVADDKLRAKIEKYINENNCGNARVRCSVNGSYTCFLISTLVFIVI